jgi:hypothetical protein
MRQAPDIRPQLLHFLYTHAQTLPFDDSSYFQEMARAFGLVLSDKCFFVATCPAMRTWVEILFIAFNDDDCDGVRISREAMMDRVEFLRPLVSTLMAHATDRMGCFKEFVSFLCSREQLDIVWAVLSKTVAETFLTCDRTLSVVE